MPNTRARVRTPEKAKRLRVDNVEGAADVHEGAAGGYPELPKHLSLRAQDKPFWDAIMRARAWDEWGRVELVLAAQLARTQGDIEAGYRLIDSKDRKKLLDAGFPSVRACSSYVGVLLSQQIKLMISLRIVGTVVGDPEIPRRVAQREAEQTIERLKNDAKPAPNKTEPPLLAV